MNSAPLRNKILLIYAVLLVLTTLLYANTLHSSFLFDDEKNVENNSSIKDIKSLISISTISYRQAVTLAYALNYHLDRANPFGYHLLNIILHACSVLLTFLISFITVDKGTLWGRNIALTIALSTALLFATNPMHTEAITYISGRPTSLATFFYLLSLFFFIQGGLQRQDIHLPRVLLFTISMISFFLSLSSKEIALSLPLLMFVYDLCFMNSKQWVNRKSRLTYFYILFPVLIALFAIKSKATIAIFKWWLGNTDYFYALNQLKVVAYAIKLHFFPINLTAEYEFITTLDLIKPEFIFIVIIWVTALYFFAKFKIRNSPVLLFSLLWLIITISPTNSFIPREDMLSERNLYLPSIGLSFLMAILFSLFLETSLQTTQNTTRQAGLRRPDINHALFLFGLMAILTCYSGLLITRNFIYKTPLIFWEDTYTKTPQKLRVLHNLSAEYLRLNNADKAMTILQKMQLINPRYYFTQINLAKIYAQKGYFNLAEIACKKAIEINPEQFESYLNLGSLYAYKGDLEQAKITFKIAKEKSKGADSPELILNLAYTYFNLGNFMEAEKEINGYLPLKDSLQGRVLLAQIYGNTGRETLAENIYRHDIVGDAALQAIANNLLGLLYIKGNRIEEALKAFEESIAFNPKLIEPHLNIAKIFLDEKKDTEKALPYLQAALKLNTDPQLGERINNLILQANR